MGCFSSVFSPRMRLHDDSAEIPFCCCLNLPMLQIWRQAIQHPWRDRTKATGLRPVFGEPKSKKKPHCRLAVRF